MPLDNKISNIIGAKIAPWVLKQLKTRSAKNSLPKRDNDNLVYLANKTGWVRLVSSVNLTNQADKDYFQRIGANIPTSTGFFLNSQFTQISAGENLAQQFTLFGGTSIYGGVNGGLRSGLEKGGAYGILGESEVQDFGYKPMPGITSVNIETQGRLGSVRAATINFKCWDKNQLDVIDALYFKLGFSMFLEWGHTYYYPNADNIDGFDPNKVRQTELDFRINPFEPGLYKEEIFRRIGENSRKSNGNYDAMLGIVTNFNFVFTQDGGYDCTLKLISLGVLGDSVKINNTSNLPNILEQYIENYNSVLDDIDRAIQAKQEAEAKKAADRQKNINQIVASTDKNGIIQKDGSRYKGTTLDSYIKTFKVTSEELAIARNAQKNEASAEGLTADQFLSKYVTFDEQNKAYKNAYPESKTPLIAKSYLPSDVSDIKKSDLYFSVSKDTRYFYIRRLSGFIPFSGGVNDGNPEFVTENVLKNTKVRINANRLFSILSQTGISLEDEKSWDESTLLSREVNETATFSKSYPSQNREFYRFKVQRNLFAKSSREKVAEDSELVPIDLKTFLSTFLNVIQTNEFSLKTISEDTITTSANRRTFTNEAIRFAISFTMPFKRTATVEKQETNRSTGEKITVQSRELIQYNLPVKIEFTDTSLIQSFTISNVDQPIDFVTYEKQLEEQNKKQETQAEQETPVEADSQATESPLKTMSTLELVLRTIQVYSNTRAILDSNKDPELGNEVKKVPLHAFTSDSGETLLQQIFSTGVFSKYILDFIGDKIDDSQYETQNQEERFKIQAKYGFATNLMANKEELSAFKPVDFKELLTTYVVPYRISQTLETGTQTNHPVYIPFGALLMILNNNCTIYDPGEGNGGNKTQTPLIYVDFNPNCNFCLSLPNQLSTDPFTCLIPIEATENLDYANIFEPNILTDDSLAINPLSGSLETTQLFTPIASIGSDNRDNLSPELLKFKDDQDNTTSGYRGRVMNILLNIDYLMSIIKDYTVKDSQNKVYLKPFIEQIITDVEKSIGNINIFRLSYNDAGNVYQIIDDQILPPSNNEKVLYNKSVDGSDPDNSELPLFGKNSIAQSLEIRTDVSTRLANMIAVSANANVDAKTSLSNSGDIFGYVNAAYVDRYIPNRKDVEGELNDQNSDGIKNAAIQFNSAIISFYNSVTPSQDQVAGATNYYIEQMNRIRGTNPATRAAAMIPLSVNFTTDGISGLAMGQAFTVPEQMLPYTYSTRKLTEESGFSDKVGFVIIGLTHTIESNVWKTAVKANMIFLKDPSVYSLKKEIVRQKSVGRLQAANQPVGQPAATPASIKTSYPELPSIAPPTQDLISYSSVKEKLVRLTDPKTAKIVFGIMWAEAAKTSNKQFKSAGGYNYTGIQTDSGRWGGLDTLFIGRFVRRDAERLREFAQFKSNEDFLNFMIEKVKRKSFTSDSPEAWATRYLDSWVFLNLSTRDKKKFDELFPSKVSIYKTASKQFDQLA